MNIYVCVKIVPDTFSQIITKSNQVDYSNLKFVINPYDEFAIEEALQIKEKIGGDSTVTLLSCGPQENVSHLRKGLAMGADSLILLEQTHPFQLEPSEIAIRLGTLLKEKNPDIILFGRQSVDSDGGVVPAMVAEILNVPHVGFVTTLTIENNRYQADSDQGASTLVLKGDLPAVFSTQKGLNSPRKPSMPNIVKSKSKPVTLVNEEVYQIADHFKNFEIVNYEYPSSPKECRMLEGDSPQMAQKLVELLKNEAKVL